MQSRHLVMLIGLAGAVVVGLPAAGSADEKKPAEKLAAIRQEQKDAEAAFNKAVESLEDNADGRKKFQELFNDYDGGRGDRFAAAVEIAKADPQGDAAVAALEWVLTNPAAYDDPAGVAAMEEVTRRHAANPQVGKLVASVGYMPPDDEHYPQEAAAAWAMIDAVAKANPDKTARAQAVLARAYQARVNYGRAAFRNKPDAEQLATVAEDAYEAVLKEYGDCPWLVHKGRGTIGDFVRIELNELRNLRIGKVAPEIEAEGVDGKPFKLSHHRGKVVAVVFWASWCGPCMAEVPHEREMTERLQGRPFTIVAVNGDLSRETAVEVMAKEKMTWPSFWNGSGGPDGPISKAWNVRTWPTVYVLDDQGVIRFKGQRGKLLEEKVNLLLDEIKTKP